MALIVADRVRENSTTTGTGTLTLSGSPLGYQTFSAAVGNGNTTYYAISNPGVNEWEVGIGTVGAGTLARDTVLASSTGTALVAFTAGNKDVFCTYPAEVSVFAGNTQTLTNKTISGANNTLSNIGNASLSNSSVTVGSTNIALGATSTTLAGLTSVTSSSFVGPLTGNADTVTNGVYTVGDQTIGGTKTFSSNPVLNGGTANGVVYANGSKVLTTGSTLTFDGSQLSVATATGNSNGLKLNSGNAGANYVLYRDTTTGLLQIYGNQSGYNGLLVSGVDGQQYYSSPSLQTWSINNSEQMRLTSTGLGIGTSSPSFRLTVSESGSFDAEAGFINGNGTVRAGARGNTGNAFFGSFTSGKSIEFWSAGSLNATLDSSGNLGLGVTPSAWQSNFKSIDFAKSGGLSGLTNLNQCFISNNAYVNSNFIYKSNGYAQYYLQDDVGKHAWFTAPSGTAGNAISFTQAMTLDASGNLGVGTTTTTAGKLIISSDGGNVICPAAIYNTYSTAANSSSIDFWRVSTRVGQIVTTLTDFGLNASSSMYFQTGGSERMRITSGGEILFSKSAADITDPGIYIENAGTLGYGRINFIKGSASGAGATSAMVFYYNGTSVGSVTTSSTATAYNTSSDYRLKENIQPMQNALATVAQLNPVTYTWKADGSDGQGFIAHELQAVVPDCVTGEKDAVDADGKPVYQGVDTSFLVATLTAAIQELKAELDATKAEVAALKAIN